MRIITGFIFILNAIAWIVFDIVCWWLTGTTLGIPGLLGIIAFFIAWGISSEASLSVADYILQSEWDIFVSKLKWSNTTTIITMVIFVLICIAFDWLSLRKFLDINM